MLVYVLVISGHNSSLTRIFFFLLFLFSLVVAHYVVFVCSGNRLEYLQETLSTAKTMNSSGMDGDSSAVDDATTRLFQLAINDIQLQSITSPIATGAIHINP